MALESPIIKRAFGKPTEAVCRHCREKMRRVEFIHTCPRCGFQVRIKDMWEESEAVILRKGD